MSKTRYGYYRTTLTIEYVEGLLKSERFVCSSVPKVEGDTLVFNEAIPLGEDMPPMTTRGINTRLIAKWQAVREWVDDPTHRSPADMRLENPNGAIP